MFISNNPGPLQMNFRRMVVLGTEIKPRVSVQLGQRIFVLVSYGLCFGLRALGNYAQLACSLRNC